MSNLKLVVNNDQKPNTQIEPVSIEEMYQKIFLLRDLEQQIEDSVLENELLPKIQNKIRYYESQIVHEQISLHKMMEVQLKHQHSPFLTKNKKLQDVLDYIVRKKCFFEVRSAPWSKIESNPVNNTIRIFTGYVYEILVKYKNEECLFFFMTGVGNVSYLNQALFQFKDKKDWMDKYLEANTEEEKDSLLHIFFRQRNSVNEFDKKTRITLDRGINEMRRKSDPKNSLVDAGYLFEERKMKADRQRNLINSPKGQKMLKFLNSSMGVSSKSVTLTDNVLNFPKKAKHEKKSPDNDPQGIA